MGKEEKVEEKIKTIDSSTKLVKKGDINPKVWYLLILPFCLIAFLIFYVSFRSDSLFSPGGEIYLTLSPIGVDETNIYKLDVSSMELTEVFENSPYSNFMPHHSNDEEKIVFVREYEDEVWNLVVFNKYTEEFTEVTERTKFFPRNPQFSPVDDSIVYWIYEDYDDLVLSEKPEDNVIYLLSPDGVIEQISNGAYPIFSPNGRYLFLLKNDGLYTHNLLTGEENLAADVHMDEHQKLDFEGLPGWANFRYNLSPDGRYIVTTDTVLSTAWILQVDSWDPFFAGSVFAESLLINNPIWPVFSPCGDYLASQEFNWDKNDWELSIYNLHLLTKESFSFSLSEYEDDFIWINDWVAR